MVKAKKNINSLLISIAVSILIISFLETRLEVCVNIRKIVKMVIPFFNGRRELIVNVFIGILGSSVVGSFAFIIEFGSEKKAFSKIWGDRFLRDYTPLLVKMGKGTLTVDEVYNSKLESDLIEIGENIKYMDKTSSAISILKVLYVINTIFIAWKYADGYIDIADTIIKSNKDLQEHYSSMMYPEEQIQNAYSDSILRSHNEWCRKNIENIEKKIIRWNDYRAEMGNRIQHNMREVLVGELYNEIYSCCVFAGCPKTELTTLHELEIEHRTETGETMDNQIIVFTEEDKLKLYSFDDEEA